MRRDASVTVTGSKGDGNEALLSFAPGSKLDGGIAINKWMCKNRNSASIKD